MANKPLLNTRRLIVDEPPFEWLITILIIYSVVSFSVETLPDLSEQTIQFLYYSEWFVVLVFSFEYLYRLFCAEQKLNFVFSFYGMIDLLAILPFFLLMAVDLRALRILRILRLLRVLKLGRYSEAFNHFGAALHRVKEELCLFAFVSVMLFYLSAVGIYQFEHKAQPEAFASIFDAMWWAVATLTTVGYGDIYPVTAGGRFFTFIVLMIGLGLVAVPTGIIASALTSTAKRNDDIPKE